jgi:hypothetical protein
MEPAAHIFLDILARRHGRDDVVRAKVAPLVRRVLETDTPARRQILDALTLVYGYHVRARALASDLGQDEDAERRFAA